METRFVPALFCLAQIRADHLHPVAREALVRGVSWYLMGAFLPDIPNEREEETFFLNRWVVQFLDQERAWQKNLSDKNPQLKALANQLTRTDSGKGGVGEMAAFALGAGVLARYIWRDGVTRDGLAHLNVLASQVARAQNSTSSSGEEEPADWGQCWQPAFVLEDPLRFPRVIEHITQSCQNVFATKMSGEALSRWSKLLHVRLSENIRTARDAGTEDAPETAEAQREIEEATSRFVGLLNSPCGTLLGRRAGGEERFSRFRKLLEDEKNLESDAFSDWREAVSLQRQKATERGRNPQPAFYQNPPTLPGETEPPLEASDTVDFAPEELAAVTGEGETVAQAEQNGETPAKPEPQPGTDGAGLGEASAQNGEEKTS